MTYVENTFICIAAPMLIVTFYTEKCRRISFFFMIIGMGICLLSAYMNAFFMSFYNMDRISATIHIAPIVEETMKFLPLLFYLLVFEPKGKELKDALLLLATGFATFENICYLQREAGGNLFDLAIRGFGTGAMHIICGALFGFGFLRLWGKKA